MQTKPKIQVMMLIFHFLCNYLNYKPHVSQV